MRHIRRGELYFRVADPNRRNPLDGSYAAKSGGRWNPPNSFPVVYLNRDIRVARANVAGKFLGCEISVSPRLFVRPFLRQLPVSLVLRAPEKRACESPC